MECGTSANFMKHAVDTAAVTGLDEFGQFAFRLPNHDELQKFMRRGYVHIEELWSTDFAEAFSREARGILAGPNRPESVSSRPRCEQRRTAPSRQIKASNSTPHAPFLAQLHFSLVPLARALTGRMLVPAHAWYNCYTTHDGLLLHVDTEGSELALLTTALGDVGPLHLHPELRGKTQDELEAVQMDPNWDLNSGVAVAYPRLGLLAHRGNMIPHHRPETPIQCPSAVAALHYASLF